MSDNEWLPAAIVCPPPDAVVQFTARNEDRVRVGQYAGMEFRDQESGQASPLQEVLLWRYVCDEGGR